MAKNSNYKNNPTAAAKAVSEEALREARDRRKNRIITIVCLSLAAIFIGAVIIGAVISSMPFGTHYVEMQIEGYGRIVIQVDGDTAPITAKNFMKLVNDKFYDGLKINRAQSEFVIQGGENKAVDLKPIEGEFSSNGHKNDISHKRGVISMARTTAPNSATSQFFITLSDKATALDGDYAGFGYVIEGMDVVDKIAEALMKCSSDDYGFVADKDAIKITYAKEIKK